jgi:DNA repair protein RadB
VPGIRVDIRGTGVARNRAVPDAFQFVSEEAGPEQCRPPASSRNNCNVACNANYIPSQPFRKRVKHERMPIGCHAIDGLLGGGVENGTITLLYGEGGSGKTNFCLQAACQVARTGCKVIYIDTEGVSLERLEQMSGQDFASVVQNILFFEPHSLDEQRDAVEKSQRILEGETKVGLLVLDSATIYYRILFGTDSEDAGRTSLVAQMTRLLVLARKRQLPVLITTQVYTDSSKNTFEPIGGHAFLHTAKAIIRLERCDGARRRATLMKHRSMREGQSVLFTIGPCGLE